MGKNDRQRALRKELLKKDSSAREYSGVRVSLSAPARDYPDVVREPMWTKNKDPNAIRCDNYYCCGFRGSWDQYEVCGRFFVSCPRFPVLDA